MTNYKIRNLNTERNEYLKEYLLENYSKKSNKDIKNDLNLSWNYIQKMAHLFGIKREFYESKRNLIKLLNLNDNITCYWIGFLLADGHLSKNCYFQVNISKKDEEHFNKIEKHLGINLKPSYVDKLNSVRYTLCDKQTVIELKEIFNWKTNKTKNIPTIPNLGKDQIFSLIIGFIDGDGSICKNGKSIEIKCDKNWKKILEEFYKILTDEEKCFKLSTGGCSTIRIFKFKTLEKIKNKAKSLNLPIMNRKWDRIIDNRIMKSDKYSIIHKLFINDKNVKDIIKTTGFSHSLVYKVKKEMDKEIKNRKL